MKVKAAVLKTRREMKGGSNAGKYAGVKEFAGPAGGAPPGTFPVNTLARARNALSRAHLAPRPDALKRYVYKKFPQLANSPEAKKLLGKGKGK